MPAVEKKRLFVAVFPSQDVVEKLSAATRRIAEQIPPGAVRWTALEQIHLTLNFLGAIEASRITEFQDALQSACRQSACHALRVSGVGCFPSLERPAIIWAGLAGALEALQKLKQSLDRALEKLGYVPETRPFHPHLTIGRVAEINSGQRLRLRRAIASFERTDFGQWDTRRINLMQSVLSPAGATYSMVKSFPLTEE